MIKGNDIEQLFESGLSDFQVKPDNALWSQLDGKLEDQELSGMFVDKFKDFTMTPSAQVWKGVEASVFVKGFWDFGLKTINIYTLTAALAAFFTISYFSYQNLFAEQPTNIGLVEQNILSEAETSQELSPELNNTSNVVSFVNQSAVDQSTVGQSTVDENLSKENNVSSSELNTNNTSPKNEFETPVLAIGEGGNDNSNILEEVTNSNTEQLVVVTEERQEDEGKLDINNTNTNQANSYTNQNTNNINNTIADFGDKDSVKTKTYASVLPDSIQSPVRRIVDTLLVYDTIVFYDTLIVEKPAKKKKKKGANNWTLTPGIGLFSSMPSHKGKSGADESYITLNNEANSASVSYSFGAQVNYDISKWRVSTGLSYTTLYEEFNYETKDIETMPVVKYTLKENGHYMDVVENISWEFDPKFALEFDTVSSSYTIHKIEYEDYIVVDTLWRYVLDTTVVQVVDSVKVVDYDTVRVATYDTTYYNGVDTTVYTNIYQNINKYTYLELPLSIGYGFEFKRFTLRPTVGAIFGVMLNAKGKGVSMINRNEVYNLSDSELPFMNLQITAYVGLGLEYKIHDGIDIFIQPFYRRNLTSMYQSSALVEKRFTGIGASFGLNYHF